MVKRSICVLLAIAAAGCAGDPPTERPAAAVQSGFPSVDAQWTGTGMTPANQTPAPVPTPALPSVPAGNPPPMAAHAAPAAAQASSALPEIPAGARYTIFCESYSGADHVDLSTQLKNLLIRNSKLKDWYVIHQAGQSSLYHGYYSEFDPKAAGSDRALQREVERARRDQELVGGIPNPQAPGKLFPRALFVPLDSPDPDAPPAWNLGNAPGYWSVQVAAFTGPDRKRQTVEAVKAARADNIPAFYYHGPTVSSVCVGSWDRDAVKMPDFMVAPGNQDFDKEAKQNKDRDVVLNLTGDPMAAADTAKKGSDGNQMRTLEAGAQVVDPTLTKTLEAYPAQAVDGYDVQLQGTDANGNPVMRPRPSMIVMIPRSTKDAATAARPSQTNEPPPPLLNPQSTDQNLGARLRGLGQ